MQTEEKTPGKWLKIINYSVAALFAVLGILVLAGFPIELEGLTRWLLGGVLLLWALYRAISTKTKFPLS